MRQNYICFLRYLIRLLSKSKTPNPFFCRESQYTVEGRGLGSRKGKEDPSYRAWSLDAGASQGLVKRLPGGRRAKRLHTVNPLHCLK